MTRRLAMARAGAALGGASALVAALATSLVAAPVTALVTALVLTLATALVPAPANAAPSDAPAAYAVSVPLVAEPAGQGLVRVALPLDLLRRLRSASRDDLRVFNAAGEALPFAWAGAPPAAAAPAPRRVALPRFEWPSAPGAGAPGDAQVRVELRSDGTVLRVERRGTAPRRRAADAAAADWLLDLSALADERPQALHLQWRAAPPGTVRDVVAVASADARAWRPVGEGTVLELHEAGNGPPALQQRLALRALEPGERYLRLRFDAPLALQAVQAEMAVAARETPSDSERFRLVRSDAHSWTLDTGAALPVTRLQVHLAQDNSVLPLTIARRALGPAPDVDGDWRTVARHTAYRLQRDGRQLESPPVDVDATAARAWRFTLDARVAPAALGPEVTLWWPPLQLVFAARGPGPFTLALGRETAAATAIERSVLIPAYRDGDEFGLPQARLGDVVERPPVSPSLTQTWADAAPEQRRRWVLWAALGVAVAVLALLAWRLARDLRSQPAHATGTAPAPAPDQRT